MLGFFLSLTEGQDILITFCLWWPKVLSSSSYQKVKGFSILKKIMVSNKVVIFFAADLCLRETLVDGPICLPKVSYWDNDPQLLLIPKEKLTWWWKIPMMTGCYHAYTQEVEHPVILVRTSTGFWRLEGILNELHIKLINKDHKNSDISKCQTQGRWRGIWIKIWYDMDIILSPSYQKSAN